MTQLDRREFVKTGTAASLAAAAAAPRAFGQAPIIMTRSRAAPVVVLSSNPAATSSRMAATRPAWKRRFAMMMTQTQTQGSDVLDALIAGVNIVELDPEETSVGYGGLPNADGVVQLDSCCMHGPKKRAGGSQRSRVSHTSLVAGAVMDTTDHHLIVGKGAQEFARGMGFKIEDDHRHGPFVQHGCAGSGKPIAPLPRPDQASRPSERSGVR